MHIRRQIPKLARPIGPKTPSKSASNAYSMTSRRNIGSFDQDLARTLGEAAKTVSFYQILKIGSLKLFLSICEKHSIFSKSLSITGLPMYFLEILYFSTSDFSQVAVLTANSNFYGNRGFLIWHMNFATSTSLSELSISNGLYLS